MATIGEFRGWEAAAARLDEVRRTVSKSGDARLLSALHLWFVEVETSRGDLNSARRHLKVASSLLENIDDCWLHGYLAVNTCVLQYHGADVTGALKWAHAAISHARQSGHQTTRRAAHANLGYWSSPWEISQRRTRHFKQHWNAARPARHTRSSFLTISLRQNFSLAIWMVAGRF